MHKIQRHWPVAFIWLVWLLAVSARGSPMYHPNDVNGSSHNIVTQPTGQYFSYLSKTPLPDNYGKTTVTPVDFEKQADLQFLKAAGVVLATVLTDTEEAAPEMLAETTAAARRRPYCSANAAVWSGANCNARGGRTLMQDESSQTTLQTALGDSSTRITVSLDGVSGATRISIHECCPKGIEHKPHSVQLGDGADLPSRATEQRQIYAGR